MSSIFKSINFVSEFQRSQLDNGEKSNILGQKLANVFFKDPVSKYLRLYKFCSYLSQLLTSLTEYQQPDRYKWINVTIKLVLQKDSKSNLAYEP